ncbi:MAG TPA: acyltransferase, partial [Microthrixaceae bacterium]|nr:acyltransferase [Microthrixaceae bacterium]
SQRSELRGGVLASLFNVENWHAILTGSSYGDFTASPSPVVHFWSLSIEEQFYLLFPLLMIGLWRVAKGRRGLLAGLFIGLAVLSAALPWIFSMSTNRAYLGSDTRAAEMFIGGALAILLSYESVRRRIALRYRPRALLLGAAVVGLGVQAYWWVTVEQSSTWLYRGGLLLYAIMTCVIIAAASLPIGPISSAMSLGPLRWFGTRSYGIYLFHWPLLLTFRQLLPEWDRVPRAGLAVAVTLVAAELSFRYFEQPIRLGRWPAKGHGLRTARITGVAAISVVALACLPLPVNKAELSTDFEAALKDFNSSRPVLPPPETTEPSPEPPALARVSTFGDSTALLAGMGLGSAMQQSEVTQLGDAGGDVALGCGVSRFQMLKVEVTRAPSDECASWQPRWAKVVAEMKPDISQLITGAWEVPDAQLPGSNEWTSIGNPQADEFIHSELLAAVDTLSSAGGMVLLVLWPQYAPWTDDKGIPALAAQHEPARLERLHQIMREVAGERPATTRLLDLPEYLGPERLADQALRPDGIHISLEKMREIYAGGLAEKI